MKQSFQITNKATFIMMLRNSNSSSSKTKINGNSHKLYPAALFLLMIFCFFVAGKEYGSLFVQGYPAHETHHVMSVKSTILFLFEQLLMVSTSFFGVFPLWLI